MGDAAHALGRRLRQGVDDDRAVGREGLERERPLRRERDDVEHRGAEGQAGPDAQGDPLAGADGAPVDEGPVRRPAVGDDHVRAGRLETRVRARRAPVAAEADAALAVGRGPPDEARGRPDAEGEALPGVGAVRRHEAGADGTAGLGGDEGDDLLQIGRAHV